MRIFLFLSLIFCLSGCVSIENYPEGHPLKVEKFLETRKPGSFFINSGVPSAPLPEQTALAGAIARHHSICETTGCPEWTRHIERLKEKTRTATPGGMAWRTHLSFREQSSWLVSTRASQDDEHYIASPAEFLAANKRGDASAIALAEFMTLKELGWNIDNLHYAVLLVEGSYTPVVLARDERWKNGTEFILFHKFRRPSQIGFITERKTKLVYATNGIEVRSHLNIVATSHPNQSGS